VQLMLHVGSQKRPHEALTVSKSELFDYRMKELAGDAILQEVMY
jgi:hypothetical protein